MTAYGTNPTAGDVGYSVAIGGKADITLDGLRKNRVQFEHLSRNKSRSPA